MREVYGKDYAANSRETIRRHTIHQFEQARIVDRNPDDPDRPTNSGKTVYVLTEEAADVLKAYGTPAFDDAVKRFIEQFGALKITYDRLRETHRIPLRLPTERRSICLRVNTTPCRWRSSRSSAPALHQVPPCSMWAIRRRSMSFSTSTSSPALGCRSLSTISCRMLFSTTRTSGGCL